MCCCEIDDIDVHVGGVESRFLRSGVEIGADGCDGEASATLRSAVKTGPSVISDHQLGFGVGFFFQSQDHRDGLFILDDFGVAFCELFGVFIDAVVA
ncbi:MAG: hypothetical protein Q9212_001634 [Teloschistes hypoglaucus]